MAALRLAVNEARPNLSSRACLIALSCSKSTYVRRSRRHYSSFAIPRKRSGGSVWNRSDRERSTTSFIMTASSKLKSGWRCHQAYSPSRTDPDCDRIYDEAFAAAAASNHSRSRAVVVLAAVGATKGLPPAQLDLQIWKRRLYSPVDVSAAIGADGRGQATKIIPEQNCFPLFATWRKRPDVESFLRVGIRFLQSVSSPFLECCRTSSRN